jgi:hypothetical protein
MRERLTATTRGEARPASLGARLGPRLSSTPVRAAAGWAVVYALLSATGQGYRLRVLYGGWQMLPEPALHADPIGSVWNLHIQPPVWNLLLGLVDAASPFGLEASHRIISLCTGMVLAAAIAATLGHLGASRRRALALTAVATLNTEPLKHAFEPRYDFAVTALLALLVWSVARLGTSRGGRNLVLPVALATILTMTRALYHPIWMIVTLAVLLWVYRDRLDRRWVAVAVAVPLLTVGGWIVKNQIMFGEPSLSSWSGMNLLRSVHPAVDPDRIVELHADGEVSDVALLGPFRGYSAYGEVMPPCSPSPGTHRVRVETIRQIPEHLRLEGFFSRADAPNFNYDCYRPVYDLAGEDAISLIKAEPGAWLTARAWSANNWFEAAGADLGDDSVFWPSLQFASEVSLVNVPHPGLPDSWDDDGLWVHATQLSLTLIALTAAVLLGAAGAARRVRRPVGDGSSDDRSAQDRQRAIVLVLVGSLVAWTMATGILLELGEQNRFRNAIDPLVLAVGGTIAIDWSRRMIVVWRRRLSG